MDSELLRTFLEVSHTKHFGKAAENLYLTQAAVSTRIRQLESQLGVQLFTRLRNNIRLTPAGEKLRPLANANLTLVQRIRQEVAIANNQSQQISIGATPNLWDAFLQHELSQLFGQFPGIAMRAEAHTATTLARQLLERTLDIAITFDAPKIDEVSTEEIVQVPLFLASSHNTDSWQEAMANHYVMVDWGTAFNVQHAQQFTGAPPAVLQTNTGRIALDFLLTNGGSAFLPESLLTPYIELGQLHIVENTPSISRSVYASYITESDRLDSFKKVIEAIKGEQPVPAESLTPTEDA
ncbi:MAG TPA: HTH-type transcriptional regulator HdfR [Oceanospirillales bacterium]|jgi:DNA-binding transcriptional LysR family regulator|nr:HTH-type transcriptional regulator HdfR [Oceanospirillales bacterium]|tara:strand:+ start:1871 stop:2755 length:885 start_codon:yes stop_codon:yes gene_type:complete